MAASVFHALLAIADDIQAQGNVPLTRLTVLKKWLDKPQREAALALFIAGRAAGKKGKSKGIAAELFTEAAAMLCGRYGENKVWPVLDRAAARSLHRRLVAFQIEYQKQARGSLRIIHNWNLMLVEKGLQIYLFPGREASAGYKLATDYCQHYDSRFGNGLNGPSVTRIMDIAQFTRTVEGYEELRVS